MKTTVGLWIDHRKAVIVVIADAGEKVLEIQSNVEQQPGRFVGVREFTGHLNQYYTILGPGEAKGELKKRLDHGHLGQRILAVETSDKMTDRQIAAKVREYFHN